MSIAILLQQILIIFLEIGTGAAVTKLGIMDDRNSKFLSNLVMSVTLPCTLLASASIDGGREAVAGMLKGYVVLEIFYILTIGICLVLSRAMHLTRGQKAVLVGAAVMPNSAFIGIPLISALLGSEAGALYGAAGIMAYNILFFTYVQHLFDPEAKVSIKAFLTPTNITTAIMVVMLVTGLRLPAILDSFCKAVGNTTTPLALMIAGSMLARSDLKKLVTNPMVWLITALRCVVFPLGFLAALYFLPLDRTLCMAILILASCPAGSLTAVLAKQYDTEGELATSNGSSPRFGCVREKEERFFLMANVYDKLKEMNITLPAPPPKGGVYTPVMEFGDHLLYCSGCGPDIGDGHNIVGKVGGDLTLEQGQKAAYNCMLNLLANLDAKLGDLNRIKRCVKVLGFVNCTDDFAQQPQVINGGSNLLFELFGEEKGLPARTAMGTNSCPGNIAVEIEMLVEYE